MGIFLPEKILIGVLTAGLQKIKANPVTYLNDIFDDYLGVDFRQTAADYLAAKSIKISQGFPLDEQRLPGWFVVPASSQEAENFIGGYGVDEDHTAMDAGEILTKVNSYSVRIITASLNGDVTLMLDAICRYILLLARPQLSEYNMNELSIQATDYDPIYQYLPQEYSMRSAIVSFQGMDTWIERFSLIKDVGLYIRFNPNEDFTEVK